MATSHHAWPPLRMGTGRNCGRERGRLHQILSENWWSWDGGVSAGVIMSFSNLKLVGPMEKQEDEGQLLLHQRVGWQGGTRSQLSRSLSSQNGRRPLPTHTPAASRLRGRRNTGLTSAARRNTSQPHRRVAYPRPQPPGSALAVTQVLAQDQLIKTKR
jgi:hypothetical protein